MLLRLLQHLDRRRRLQTAALVGVMLLAAVAEMATLGAIVPVLSLVSTPDRVSCRVPLLPCAIDLEMALLFFAVAVLLSGALRIFLTWFSTRLTFAIGADLGLKIYKTTLHEPYSEHVKSNSSEIISDILKVDGVVASVLYPAINVVVALVLTTAILATLLRIDVTSTAISFLVFSVLYVGMFLFTHKQRVRNSILVADLDARRIKAVQEGLGGIRDILLDGAQRVYYEKFDLLNRTQRTAQAQNSYIGIYPRFVVETVGLLFIALAGWYFARQGGNIAVGLPVLGALALGAQKLLPQVQIIYLGFSAVRGNMGIVEDVVQRLDRAQQYSAPAATAASTLPPHPEKSGDIPILELVDASFSYVDGMPVLQGLSLCVQKGSRVGFVGRTGSGKSTLIDLLMGLLFPTRGVLLFNGHPVTPDNVRAMQDRIAHVPQAIFLTDASIAENIAFGVPPDELDLPRVKEAAARAQLADFIASLPQGYDTQVGERGIRLSGGQRQRIGIARAFYKKTDILILDEATSALDDATEARIMDAIYESDPDVTVLMIAHRTSSLVHCDVVYEIQEGRISRQGRHVGAPRVTPDDIPASERA